MKGSINFQSAGATYVNYGVPISWTLTYDLTPVVNPLSVTSLSPSTAAAGSGAFTLTVNGTGFAAGAVVQWNGTPLTTTLVSDSQLTAAVPASLLASAGAAVVSVVEGGVNIGSATFTVNPPGQGCNFTFSTPGGIGSSGGAGSVSVTASRGDCTWSASSNVPWITFTNNSITGSGTLNFNAAANPGGSSRTGTITVGGQSFTVTQGGTTCTYSMPIATQAFTAAGGSGVAALQAPSGCAWTASSGVSWVTVAAPAGGSGDGTVAYVVAANSSAAARAGTITIANQPYTVTQAGGAGPTCVGTVPSAAQAAIEGRTEVLGDYVLNCSGISAGLTADILLTLNSNVTNAVTSGATDAVLTVNGGSPRNGIVAGYNSLRWPGVGITPAADGTASVRIAKVRADASILAGNLAAQGSLQPVSITGQASLGPLVAVTGAVQTMANAAPSLKFSRIQANPPAGGAQTMVPLVFQETKAASFAASATRLRMVLSNVPTTVQVYAPVFPAEGPTRAQLYSADASGSGGSPVAGVSFAGGTYQLLTVNSAGTATATWVVLVADPAKVETWTFPLILLNAATGDLNQMGVAGSLAPVSDVSVAGAAPVPRYRDLSLPQKLVSLRMTTSVQTPSQAAVVQVRAPVTVGSKITFTSQLTNDTSDPTQSATNVVIRNNLPSGLSLVSCTVTGGASCGGSGNQVQINYGTLGAGQNTTVTVVAQVDPSLAGGIVIEDAVSASSDQVNLDLLAGTASTSFILLPGGPVAVGGSPAAGSGSAQIFIFQFSHPLGYQNLGVVNVLINNALDGRHACYLAYAVQSTTLYLVDDAGDAGGPYAGTLPLGGAGTIQNSQCAVSLVSALGDATTLTLKLNITFTPGFGGNRITYVAARGQTGGNSDWQALGVWQAPFTPPGAIAVTGVTPARGAAPAGTNTQFKLTLTDSKGAGDFGVVNMLVNSFIDGRKACYLAYSAPTNTLYLVDDAGDAGGPFAGGMVMNGTGGVENGQCAVNGSGSTVGFAANTLTLTLNITFKAAFSGNRVLYVAGRDRTDANSTDWQAAGTFTVQ